MASAAQNNGGSSALNATTQQGRKEVNQALVRENFDRILDCLQRLSLHGKAHKLFIVYAHDDQESGFEAYQEIVKKYSSWFKKIGFDIHSDRSPHGHGHDHLLNQVCLLPKRWHKENSDYVLVFYSKVLISYMNYERGFKHENKTYSDAIIETCEQQDGFQDQSQQKWDAACEKIRAVQQTYSETMKGSFHHVLAETARLGFTNKCGDNNKTITIMLSDDEEWEDDLKWQPRLVHNKDTQIRIRIEPEEEYLQFLKVLLEFETLERDRPLIDVMIRCFEVSVKLLEEDLQPEMYRTRMELLTLEALRSLSDQNVLPTITALYQAVVRSLWRKDIPKLDKVDHGKPVTVEIINAVQNPARLERLVDTESNFLEEMANMMMGSDRLEFTDEDIAEVIQRTESKGNLLPLSLEKNLPELSLLRSYPSECQRKYRFVHLTFQEFFAARYLARRMAHDRASFETILRQHKYDHRYEAVWIFLTGLLSQVEELDFFFDLLDDEPRDLMGIQHIHLIMHCLSECQIQIRPSRWNEYQKGLEDWRNRNIERLCANLAMSDSSIIEDSLGVFLCRPVKDLTPIYINGETLYFYTVLKRRLFACACRWFSDLLLAGGAGGAGFV